jgi:hypothetical protein
LRLTKRSTRAAGWAVFEAKLVGGGRVTANVRRLKSTFSNVVSFPVDDANPYNAPQPTASSDGVVVGDRVRAKSNVMFWAFFAAASFALLIFVATNLNARYHDPWMTPRYSQSMLLWWRFGGVMGRIMLLSFPFGVALCFTASTRPKRLIARILTVTLIFIPLVLGLPI